MTLFEGEEPFTDLRPAGHIAAYNYNITPTTTTSG